MENARIEGRVEPAGDWGAGWGSVIQNDLTLSESCLGRLSEGIQGRSWA